MQRAPPARRGCRLLRTRRYGATHIAARVAQVQSALDALAVYLAALDRLAEQLADDVPRHLWIAPDFAQQAAAHLAGTRTNIVALQVRASAAADGFRRAATTRGRQPRRAGTRRGQLNGQHRPALRS